RFDSTKLVREFLKETPHGSSIVVTGREHYFDSFGELSSSLGIDRFGFSVLSLNDFTHEQVEHFLTLGGWTGGVPDWLPTRLLLVGDLASGNALSDVLDGGEAIGPA